MAREVKIGNRVVGDGHPAYIVAEMGVNHNGSMEIAKDLIRQAHHAGVDAVKFQKRTPELCVPKDQWEIMRETPWGYISYIEYRRKMEFQQAEYTEIDRYCKELGMSWFASVWDEPSVEFLEAFNPICYKVPSASLTDHRPAALPARYGPPGDSFDRHVDHGADPRSGEPAGYGQTGDLPRDQHLSRATRTS